MNATMIRVSRERKRRKKIKKKLMLGVRVELTTSGLDDHLITHMGI